MKSFKTINILIKVKMDYHSIRFFTFLLLREQVYPFSSAFLCVHIRTNQTVTTDKSFPKKKFFAKRYSLILKYRSYHSYTKFLSKYNSLLSVNMDI